MQGKKIIIAHKWNTFSVAQQSVALAMELSKQNEVIFLAQNKVEHGEIKINPHLRVLNWPNDRPTSFKDYLFYRSILKKFRPDITISHFASINIMIFTGWLMNVPHRVVWYHTISAAIDLDGKTTKFKSNLQRKRRRLFYILATNFISVSNAAKLNLHEEFHVPLTKITCVHNSISNPQIKSKSIDTNLIRFFGRYDFTKGVNFLIEAAHIVVQRNSKIIFELYGGGEKGYYKQMILEKGLENNVFLKDSIPYKDVRQYMSEAYLTVVPSLFEAFGMIVIESFSAGTPVIGSNTGGIAEIIEHNKTGMLFEKGNSKELAMHIETLLDSPETRYRLSQNCFAVFQSKFSIDAYIQNVISFLNQL